MSIVLGRALLWQIYNESGKEGVPSVIRNRIESAINDLRTDMTYQLKDDLNPVLKVPLICDGKSADYQRSLCGS